MINPLLASENIKKGYIDYLTTSFHFADKELAVQFEKQLKTGDTVAKGPFLETSGSFVSGRSIAQMVQAGDASSLFQNMESCPESKKELKIERTLHAHQEMAFSRVQQGENIIVTTGTGSGKTECFLIPIIDYLLKKIESGSLQDAIQAIIIYPMNALANDQMKRLRSIFKDFPAIRFGLYNGNTEYSYKDGLVEYKKTFGAGSEPLPNEIISRHEMQERPPHILITNYSMMEYLLLRPKDDMLFKRAELRFVVLDEAHIYRGSTGIETSLLLRRMRARIPNSGKVQYILTSATLGDKEDNMQITRFGENLCGVPFKEENIIRSEELRFDQKEKLDFPDELWLALDKEGADVGAILKQYDADLTQDPRIPEKLAELCLHSRLYVLLRNVTVKTLPVSDILSQINTEYPISQEALLAFINICTKAEKNGAPLFKSRYHYFVRALEGVYSTLGSGTHLSLHRNNEIIIDGKPRRMFELAICSECGRIAIAGKIENDQIVQYAARSDEDNSDFFIVKGKDDKEWFEDEDENAEETCKEDYVVCAECGSCASYKGEYQRMPCDHSTSNWIHVHRIKKLDSGRVRCPACGNGYMRRFYIGNDAATSVLATELYEQLPQETLDVIRNTNESISRKNIFGVRPAQQVIRKDISRQFLCFSDSRSEAAYFACYMGQSYNEFLRRRGIWQTAEKLKEQGIYSVTVSEFVNELAACFEINRSFLEWDRQEERAFASSRRNAWVAVLNEIFNSRRATGLISMGLFSVEYIPNQEAAAGLAESYNRPVEEMKALLDLLILDAVNTGAITCKAEQLLESQREYIFFTTVQQRLVKVKQADMTHKGYLHGWCGRKRSNGKYYPNNRIQRICLALGVNEEEADQILEDYWDFINQEKRQEFTLDVKDFNILLYPYEQKPFYRCKKCGCVTPVNLQGRCPNVRCNGTLVEYDALKESESNHYARLYRNKQMKPLYIKEHTAQLSKNQQSLYQNAFVNKTINALSCSTTFEMGVDVGSLETVYLRNVPPNPANYVQRAGRAGRQKGSAAYVLTYAKLSSHDFTYFDHPEQMITGKISAPIFTIENDKIIRRHIYAVALSYFLKKYPEVYDGDDRSNFLLKDGYHKLVDMLNEKPEALKNLLKDSIPIGLHDYFELDSFGWLKQFIGDNGTLSMAYESFHETINDIKKEIESSKRRHDLQEAARLEKQLMSFRADKDDKFGKRSLIDFWVRNNILPKYGFPVDTVELFTDGKLKNSDDKMLSLSRDLQMAIAEYAPGCEVIADGKLYTSRYIRKMPGKNAWEYGFFATCPICQQKNFSKVPVTAEGRNCVSCNTKIARPRWSKTLEPRMGFVTDGEPNEVPLHRPERAYKTDAYYIGDQQRKLIDTQSFAVNDRRVTLQSTTNDSLVVVGNTEYYVCPTCGYASESELPEKHRNSRGFECSHSGVGQKVCLSHDFKTDVVQIRFLDGQTKDLSLMLSVMYALLEGLSQAMGIERNDIQGCLHLESTSIGLIYTLILYDAVAGGAGHVRRMVTEDGNAFIQVIDAAIRMLSECKCDTSCYHCIRNYYNQKVHDMLNRKAALEFLKLWLGNYVHEEKEKVTEEIEEKGDFEIVYQGDLLNDYKSWQEVSANLGIETNLVIWDNAGIPYEGELCAEIHVEDQVYDTFVIWPDRKLIVVSETLPDDIACACRNDGWMIIPMSTEPEQILMILNGRKE